MSIGIRLHDAAGETLAERAGNARAQGFKCAHLALGKVFDAGYMRPEAATPGLASYVKQELGGLPVAVLGCYLNLAHPDEAAYRAIAETYVAHLRLARWLGAGVVGTETGNPNAAYAYDPEKSHTEEALALFIDRARPIVRAAEKLGAVLAIEPVYTHIVYDAKRARRVLDEIASPNLQIILDPVNLLHADNVARADEVIQEALELLGRDTAVVHIKDYRVGEDGGVLSMAAGLGVMDYAPLMRYVREQKPHVDMTLEDTLPENAQAAREHIARALAAVT